HYAEPYAGGAGLALSLLFAGCVSEIHLNDYDRGISSFWRSVIYDTEELVSKIRKTRITVAEWRRQKDVCLHPYRYRRIDIGFANFFLNRTNRSGVIKSGGIIGGIAQDGDYLI